MQHDTLHPWHLHLRGSLHVIQGWLLRDPQRVLQGRYERLLGEIGQAHQRLRGAADHVVEPVVVQRQLTA